MGQSTTAGDGDARERAVDALRTAIRRGELVVVVGSGVSLAITGSGIPQLSWAGLVRHGLKHAAATGRCTEAQRDERLRRLDTQDLDDLIDVAEYVQRKLEGPEGDLYGRWLEKALAHVRPANPALQAALRRLADAGVPLSTLNYDELLETATGLPGFTLDEARELQPWLDGRRPAVLHLHGVWSKPAGCVLGRRDYWATQADERRAMLQRALGALKPLLFVGCGDTFADPNFSTLVAWLRRHMGAAAPKHHALVVDADVERRARDPAWAGFVDPVGFGDGFAALPAFLESLVPAAPARRPAARPRATDAPRPEHRQALQAYREFLIADCGQMSIEGVRADLDTAQRKFDIEKLFVPLTVAVAGSQGREGGGDDDDERAQARREWVDGRRDVPFGEVMAHERQLVLLALPGGGKSMLLKRLAVAYLQPERRRDTVADALPDLPLVPVLIRCREWREHVRKPILTMLEDVGRVTGQLGLEALRNALLPHFRDGTALLLIDGLDEIHEASHRAAFVDHIEAFSKQFPKARLVITSREAGFDLVAPSLRRRCSAWRIAPLGAPAIALLCEQWQRLMVGSGPEALAEAHALATEFSARGSRLGRLAENPLLLTMLLVVKNANGRLPPDRVSLYERAVEVLLDTWNIRGHEKLDMREAMPQLACVAFVMLQRGLQTATLSELIELLDEIRRRLPEVARYARDSSSRFLERVEQRSSLLIQAGLQRRGARDEPVYQFRHLTFQEYLAAVAACEGHYLEYAAGHDLLSPLAPHLLADAWKEVVPMAAVKARKRAEPLLQALIADARAKWQALLGGQTFEGYVSWVGDAQPPPALDRLLTCFAEEVEASPETTAAALELVAVFSRGDPNQRRVEQLARGPYGAELWQHVFRLFDGDCGGGGDGGGAPVVSWLELTASMLGAGRVSGPLGISAADAAAVRDQMVGGSREAVCLCLFTCAGLAYRSAGEADRLVVRSLVTPARLQELLAADDRSLRCAALWTWAVLQQLSDAAAPTPAVLDQLLARWLGGLDARERDLAAHALYSSAGLPRTAWRPRLAEAQRRALRDAFDDQGVQWETWVAVCVVAFHDGKVWPRAELLRRIDALRARVPDSARLGAIRSRLVDAGESSRAGASR